MQQPIENYWRIRLNDVKESLEANGFDAFIAGSPEEAKRIFFEEILPESGAKSVSWGGSMTIRAVGVHEAVMNKGSLDVLNPDDPTLSPDERLERRRQALLVDIYLTGTNAVIETGQLVNLDAFGNRVGALVFGPKNVVVFVGRNKITADLESAMARIKEYVAPINCMRFDRKTPCATTGLCQDCASPDRICSVWTITEKSLPKGRIKVILINQDLGF